MAFQAENGAIYWRGYGYFRNPLFEILDANKNHEPLKERSAVNNKGEFTTVASEALDFSASQTDPVSNLVSIGGGYKGFYLTYLTEILTSALIGMPASSQMSSSFVPEEHGAIILAFSPKAMGTEEKFQASLDSLHQALKTQTPKEGTNISVPGERNNQRLQERADALLEIDQSLIDKLNSLSQ
jgi:LDH2 family malate/lactate/ureidoglycolate dehydrogenase